jgi:general secretion pathway protein D
MLQNQKAVLGWRSWTVVALALWLALGAAAQQPSAKSDAKAAPKSSEQKVPAQPPPNSAPAAPKGGTTTIVCPAGEVPVKHATPFGETTICGAPPAATAPAAADAPPPAQAPATQAPALKPEENRPTEPAKPEPGKTEPQPAESAKPEAQTGEAAKPAPQNITITPPPAGADGAVALNLENADLFQVLRILGGELKINYIVDPAVRGTVTINTSGNVSRKDLFGLLQMILEINNAAAVKSPNGYYSIVPLTAARQQPMNFRYAKEAEGKPAPEDAFTLWVVPMRFISASEMSNLLKPFMSSAGQIVVQDKGNIMLIEESSAKIRQLQDIIAVFDDPVMGRQRVQLFPVKNNLATNLVSELKSVFAGYGLSGGASAIQFLPMERMNSILAISASPDVFPEVQNWINKLDQPAQTAGMRNFVYKVQNAKAADLRDVLIELYGGSVPRAANVAPSETAPPNPMGPNTTTPPPATPPPGTPAAAAAPKNEAAGAGVRMQGEIRIMADEKNNALIVQSTAHDYEVLLTTLKDLDVLPRQVLIDARIYEVDLTGDLTFGVRAFLDKKNSLTAINKNGSFDASQGGLHIQGFAMLPDAYQLQVFLTAQENRSRIKTLSAPSILVTDNTTARVQVGAEVPVPIGSSLTPVQSGGSSLFAQTIQFRDTGVILTVTPRINASGVVNLQIGQEVSNAVPNTTSGIVAPVINKSQFQTSVVLRDGQALALGGIITDTVTNSRNRIPLLGDIPGVGALFGNTTHSTGRKELVMLITPHVAQDAGESLGATQDLVGSMNQLKREWKRQLPAEVLPPTK